MLRVESSGSFNNTNEFLRKMAEGDIYGNVARLAEEGVAALKAATPRGDTGATSAGWTYEIEETGGNYTIHFRNDHEVDGFNVAVGLQHGHATGGGGWVSGQDYINPALAPIFDKIANKVWEEVHKA